MNRIYDTPEICIVEFASEGILCYSQKFELGVEDWTYDSSDSGGDAE